VLRQHVLVTYKLDTSILFKPLTNIQSVIGMFKVWI